MDTAASKPPQAPLGQERWVIRHQLLRIHIPATLAILPLLSGQWISRRRARELAVDGEERCGRAVRCSPSWTAPASEGVHGSRCRSAAHCCSCRLDDGAYPAQAGGLQADAVGRGRGTGAGSIPRPVPFLPKGRGLERSRRPSFFPEASAAAERSTRPEVSEAGALRVTGRQRKRVSAATEAPARAGDGPSWAQERAAVGQSRSLRGRSPAATAGSGRGRGRGRGCSCCA